MYGDLPIMILYIAAYIQSNFVLFPTVTERKVAVNRIYVLYRPNKPYHTLPDTWYLQGKTIKKLHVAQESKLP
jgi:hypothetical protein